jgi:probable F420-dependent oxidoreductase
MGGMKVRFAVAPQLGSTDVGAFASYAERRGFDGIWLSDVPLAPILDPLLGLAFAAGQTKALRLGANVVPLGRNPFLLAKELAQLDRLSGGRLLLSFVPGIGQPGEREALGTVDGDRGVLLEEALGIIRSWWAGEAVSHQSPRWSFTAVPPAARPVQDPLEVWLGGRGPKALDRVGRIADGWLGAAVTPDEAAAARQRIEQSAANAGRRIDPEHFGLSIAYARTALDRTALANLRTQRADVDPDEVVPLGADALRALLGRHVEGGLSKFVLRPAAGAPVAAGAAGGPSAAGAPSAHDELDWLADVVLDLQT